MSCCYRARNPRNLWWLLDLLPSSVREPGGQYSRQTFSLPGLTVMRASLVRNNRFPCSSTATGKRATGVLAGGGGSFLAGVVVLVNGVFICFHLFSQLHLLVRVRVLLLARIRLELFDCRGCVFCIRWVARLVNFSRE